MLSALVLLLASLFLAPAAMAQESKKFAVLPFTYSGPKKFSYYPKAFQASLTNDLEWMGQVMPAPDSTVEGLKAPSGKAEALDILRNSGLDYIVTGDISILDKEATLKLEAFDKDGGTWAQTGQMSIDEIVPWLDAQSKVIMGDVFHRPGYSTAEKTALDEKKEGIVGAAPTSPANAAFISAEGGDYRQDKLNPQFRYEGGAETHGRWRSQTLRFFSTSMCVGDGDGDGKNEVFLLTKNGLAAYRYEAGKLKFLQKLDLSSSTEYIRLELMDIDRDGIPELVVGSYYMLYTKLTNAPEGTIKSHIISFKDGKFKFLVKDYKKFLGVLRMPPTFMPVMVAQDKGIRHLFDRKVYEAYYKDGDVVLGQVIPLPKHAGVYTTAFYPDGLGYKYLVLDDFNRIRVYSQTMERLYTSEPETYNSSGVAVTISERPVGMGPGMADSEPMAYNIPFRMVIANLTQKDKYEVLVNKDLSIFGKLFGKFNYYSQGEIHALVWDGVGLNLAWKTRRIKGQVSDIALADVNNDGNEQLVVMINTFPGGMGFSKRKTVVLAYDLQTQ
jgi:hypothetical protein